MRNIKGAKQIIKAKAYKTLIRPIAEYAGALWDQYKRGRVRAIENVRRKAARKVTGRMNYRKWVEANMGQKAGNSFKRVPVCQRNAQGERNAKHEKQCLELAIMFLIIG